MIFEKIFDFAYIAALGDAVNQKAYSGEKTVLQKNREARDIVKKYIDDIIASRRRICELYDSELAGCVGRPKAQENLEYNYAYYPVVFADEQQLLRVFDALAKHDIYPRRYFYPSLNKLSYVNGAPCPISEDIASRIACMPLYPDLAESDARNICQIIKDTL